MICSDKSVRNFAPGNVLIDLALRTANARRRRMSEAEDKRPVLPSSDAAEVHPTCVPAFEGVPLPEGCRPLTNFDTWLHAGPRDGGLDMKARQSPIKRPRGSVHHKRLLSAWIAAGLPVAQSQVLRIKSDLLICVVPERTP